MKRYFKRLLSYDLVRPALGWLFVIAGLSALYTYRLSSLVNPYSINEAAVKYNSFSFHQLIINPINAPYRLIAVLLAKLHQASLFSLRLISVVFAIIILVSFYLLLRKRYSRIVATFSTILLASNSWFLHVGRSAQTDILLTLSTCLLLALAVMKRAGNLDFAFSALAIVTALILYVPGAAWLILLIIVWRFKTVKEYLGKLHLWSIGLGTLLVLASLGSIIYSFVQRPRLVFDWLGLPQNSISVAHYFNNVWHAFLSIFISSNPSSVSVLTLPLLDAFLIVMFILGLYVCWLEWRLDNTKVLLGGILIGLILCGFGAGVNVIFLLPFIFLVIASGIALLMQQWFKVFPRNPIARSFGVIVLSLAIGVSCWYQLDKYFVAWQHSPSTKAYFRYNIPKD